MQMEISYLKLKKRLLLSEVDNSGTQINPAPGYMKRRGRGHACYFRRKEEKLGMHENIYSYESWFYLLTIIMDFQVSKSIWFKAAVLNTAPRICLLCISLSLSLSLSLIQTCTGSARSSSLISSASQSGSHW